jgi:hypothetical protein
MKRILVIINAIVLTICATAQNPTTAPRLIVRVDDMGSTHSANVANLKCIEAGIIQDIQLMVVGPWFPEAVRMLQDHTEIEVGLHFTITSEWETIKWRPLTQCPGLKDADGYFFPMMNPNPNYKGLSVAENNWKLDEIEQELRAQIELCRKYIPRVNNITMHMGMPQKGAKEIEEMLNRVALEYKLIMVNQDVWKNFAIAGYKGPTDKPEGYIRWLESLQPGKLYSSIEHPGLNDSEMAATWHIGYTNVAEERQDVTDLYTSAEVREAIKRLGIIMVGYGDVLNVDLTLKK